MNDQQQGQLKQAEANLKAGQFAQATTTLLALYDESDDEAILAPLAQGLLGQHKVTEANRLIDDHFSYFVNHQLELMLEILVADQRFVAAHIIMEQLPAAQTEKLRGQLYQAEAATKPNGKIVRQFKHLGAFPVARQRQISEQAEQLPIDVYQAAVQQNLLDPDVHPVWRLQLLNNLMRLRISTPSSFLWIDGKQYQAVPSQLVDSTDSAAYHQLLDLLTTKYGQTDPIQQAQLQALMQVELQNLFPFVDQLVDNPEQWLTEFERQSRGELPEKATTTAGKWLNQVEMLMTNLID
ncbi:hypothetical protein M3M39_04030 [Fructilactobacillus hinvesii]|uniref:Uncharacterized protein n=1 Tax=Fructilactobacillus hinvesii TaxID=2940300 RepID=A0ABY5BUF6_9LACO|nr:hypothetical protein [Fructilactobacillus hinvesii]USS87298.1 hypothetical protein M3M39_04030 [Fructilactobacillus hinvesii]